MAQFDVTDGGKGPFVAVVYEHIERPIKTPTGTCFFVHFSPNFDQFGVGSREQLLKEAKEVLRRKAKLPNGLQILHVATRVNCYEFRVPKTLELMN